MKKISKNAVVFIIIVLIAAAGLTATYFIGKENYKDKFLQGTIINGYDCSGETVQQVKDDIQDDVLKYSLTINERGGKSETITGEAIGLIYTDNGEIDEIMNSQDNSTWFMNTGGKDFSVDTAYTFDEDDLKELVSGLDCFKEENVVKPENAFISCQDSSYIIIPEVEGNELDLDKVYKAVLKAVKGSDTSIDLEKLGLYIEPDVRSDDPALVSQTEKVNKMLSTVITYDFVDRQFVCDRESIINWITDNGDGTYSLDRNGVYDWVGNMGYETDTFGLNHPFMTSYGVEVMLPAGGDYGWYIDQEATANILCNCIEEGTVATLNAEYIYTAQDRSKYDIGNSYVEICITTQTLWCYYNGELITTTPIISGCEERGTCTPSGGVWAIDGKKTDWDFTYFPGAHSKWWMPFNDMCGIHDASWQPASSYTVETYKTAGSHGCINTPDGPMELIYEYMEIGFPVVVYYSLDQLTGPEPTQSIA